MTVAEALLQLDIGDTAAAIGLCQEHAAASPLARNLADFLQTPDGAAVYDNGAAFERFISTGSNVALYARVIDELRGLNRQEAPLSLLDIGAGDGRITAATVPASCESLHVLEPSRALLTKALERLDGRDATVHATCSTLQDLLVAEPQMSWHTAQSSFAMHNLGPAERRGALADLARRTGSLTLIEFDVPDYADASFAHASYAASAYEAGIAEYADDDLVINGFLLPVLVGQFDPDRQRHTFEQSAAAWQRELSKAGFESVSLVPVCDYWWADAVMICGNHQ